MVHQDGTPEEEQARRLEGLDWFHKDSREEDMWTQITKVLIKRDKGYRIHERALRFSCVVKSGDLVNTDDNRGVVIVQDSNLLQCFKNMVVALEEHVPGNKFTYQSVPMHLWSASEILYLIYHFNEKQVVRTKCLKSGPVNASISKKLITKEGWKVFQSYIRLISQIKCFCGDELSTTKLLDGVVQNSRLVSFDALVKYLDKKCQLAEVGSGYRSPRDFTFIKNDDELNLFIKWCLNIYWCAAHSKKSAAVSKKRCQQEAYCSKKRCKTTKEMTTK